MNAAKKSVEEVGYLVLDDMKVGEYVKEMEQKGFGNLSFFSPLGREYCKQHIFRHPQIVPILEYLLEDCSLGHWKRYNARPGLIECFRKAGPNEGIRLLVVQQWPEGSVVDYYGGSHLVDLPAAEGKRRTLETSKEALREAGCSATEESFPKGGLVIRDGRLYSESKDNYVINFIFGTKEGLKDWKKLTLPKSSDSVDLVREIVNMETSRTRVNWEFEESPGKVAEEVAGKASEGAR